MLGIGVIPALGMQSVGFKITASVAYGITIPVGCLFAFVFKLGISGLLWGACIGHMTQASLYAYWILKTDWFKISQETAERIKEDGEKTEGLLDEGNENEGLLNQSDDQNTTGVTEISS